jgi:hypothetical protein
VVWLTETCLRVFVIWQLVAARKETEVTHDQLAGYTLLAGYGLLLLGLVKAFGLRRVVLVILGIVFLGVGVAFGTLRGVTNRR